MFITEEEAQDRLKDKSNLFRQEPSEEEVLPDLTDIKKLNRGGRSKNTPNMTQEDRVTVATMADAIGNKRTQELTGISSAQVEQLKAGQVGHKPNGSLQKSLNKTRNIVAEKAIDLVLSTLNKIDDDKLGQVKTARELAGVAKDLSSVAERMADKAVIGSGIPNIVFYVPNTCEEGAYEVIDVEPIASS
jgi:hypothetical protein